MAIAVAVLCSGFAGKRSVVLFFLLLVNNFNNSVVLILTPAGEIFPMQPKMHY